MQQGAKALKILKIFLKIPAWYIRVIFTLVLIAILARAIAVPARRRLAVIDMVMQGDLHLAELIFRGGDHMRWNVDIFAHAVPRRWFLLLLQEW